MDRNQGRNLSAEERLRVVEGRQSAATISEVCRHHQVDHAQFYRTIYRILDRHDLLYRWKRLRIVRDNGSQFVAKEWGEVMRHFELEEIPIRVRHTTRKRSDSAGNADLTRTEVELYPFATADLSEND